MSDGSAPSGPANLVDLLDRLEVPAPPPAVSMVPQTGGWVVLALVLAAAAAYAGYRYAAHRRLNAYRGQALRELAAAGPDPAAVAAVVRRTALAAYPRRDVASLSGRDWLEFLDHAAGTTDFTQGGGREIAAAPYAPAQTAGDDLIRAARDWIVHHKRGQGA